MTSRAMRPVALLLLFCCYGVAGRLHKEFVEVAGLLKSQATRAFSNENEFVQKAHEFQAMVHSEAKAISQSVSHPRIVRAGDTCDESCWNLLQQRFGKWAVSRLTDSHLTVVASSADVEAFAAEHPELVKYHMAMLPEMKVDADVSKMAGGKRDACFPTSTHMHNRRTAGNKAVEVKKTPQTVTLRVVMVPLQPSDFDSFHAHVVNLEKEWGLKWDYSRYIPDRKRTLEVTLTSCANVARVAQALSRRPEVYWIERVYPAYTHNRWSNGVCDSGKAEVSPLQTNPNANFTGLGDIIGVSDTGIDMQNCYFRDEEVETPYVWSDEASAATVNLSHRKVVQYYMLRKNNGQQSDGIDDDEGHGTHVSGTVAGRAVHSYGDYKLYQGMSADAKISFFDIGDPTSSNEGQSLILPDDLNTDLFSVMYQSGARIFTNSWGTASNNYDSRAQEVDEFMWENKDALVLFSAGNSGSNGAYTTGSPSTNKNGVSVGATLNDHDSWQYYEGLKDEEYDIEAVAGFSSQGPTQDNRLKPDVLAPGHWITSATGRLNSSSGFCEVQAMRGTSMACPTAASFALKIRRYFLDGFYPTGERNLADGFVPSGALLKALLVHSGQKMKYSVNRDTKAITVLPDAYPSNIQGYGRIDMSKVLHFGAASTSPITMFVKGAVDSSSLHYASFTPVNRFTAQQVVFSTNAQPAPIRITFSYTDPPGSVVTTGNPIVNTLTMAVTSNFGHSFSPYLAEGTIQDNTQVIDIPDPTQWTTYTVTITCFSALTVEQPYALVITGATTYVDNVETEEHYSIPEDNFTASGGALKYIVALGALTLVLGALVVFFRRVSKRKTSMMLDPREFEATDDFYEEEVQDTGRGGRKSVFATIRNIRSNHRRAQQENGGV